MKPEYSPVDSPRQYKQETLKNVLLFMQLIPFVEAGIVNIIPDPCSLNPYLQKQIWKMAESRHKEYDLMGYQFDKAHTKDIERLVKDDFQRSMTGLPDESLKWSIRKALPQLSNKEIDNVLVYMKKQRLEDPLALLQPMLPGESEGELSITHLSPNLELGLFLAQITGSLIYTDNAHRWMEMTSTSTDFGRVKESSWEPLESSMKGLVLSFEINPMFNLKIRQEGGLGSVRNTLRKILVTVQNEHESSRVSDLNRVFCEELDRSHKRTEREWETIHEKIKQHLGGDISLRYTRKIDCVIPTNGISLNTVHRLLLSHGSTKYWKSVPMAIFFQSDQ
jgi:hypothetical protein